MGSSLKQVWLCCCVDWFCRTMCWEDDQLERQQLRQVGGERWASLEHENIEKSLCVVVFPPTVLAVDARKVSYRRQSVSFWCGKCLADAF